MEEIHKQFLKANHKILKEIFDEKIYDLTTALRRTPKDARDSFIDGINILEDWLRELEILDKKEQPKNSFV
jgi:hypothetical protein